MTNKPYFTAFYEDNDIWDSLDEEDKEYILSLNSHHWGSQNPIENFTISQKARKILIENGVVTKQDDYYRFTKDSFNQLILSKIIIKNETLPDKSPNEILESFQNFLGSNDSPFNFRRMVIVFSLVQLNNDYERTDIFDYIFEDDISDSRFWVIYDPLHHTFPLINLDAESFSGLLKSFANNVQSDMSFPWSFGSLRFLGINKPELSLQIIDNITNGELEINLGPINENLIIGVSNAGDQYNEAVIDRCHNWLEKEDEMLQRLSISSLASLSLEEKYPPMQVLEYVTGRVNISAEMTLTLGHIVTNMGRI